MKRSTLLILATVVIGWAGVTVTPAMAQRDRGLTARGALELLAKRFGAERAEWIVEMRGFEGVPDPEEWEITTWDPKSRFMVREYWAGDGEATDEGNSDKYYPDRSPFGFVRVTDLKLDSKAAFVIAEAEARKAKMGFDALNYILRCREFSREPVWTLELIDADERLSGKVYISGSTGEVLRTVWIYNDERGRDDGRPLIIDSAAPREGGNTSTGARSEPATNSGTRTEGGDPPMRKFVPGEPEPDPLTPPTVPPTPGTTIPKPPIPPTPGTGTDTRIPPPPIPQEP
ncbi:MAG: hypothetical protein KDN20_18380 [Verrucomicrobiae bacterium]|nr:hypothetical protein [Verrucomicrobiae bacterium]